ncbi:MAG: DUF3866 family protein [Actinomycetota bacterium]
MIRIRRGTVVEARATDHGVTELVVDVDGARADAIAYDGLTGPVEPGDHVVLNTTAVALGLGTGGVHIVMAVEGRSGSEEATGHAMKLRYSPVQTSVDAVEQTHAGIIDGVLSLDGMPVIAAGLHSTIAPAAIGAHAIVPGLRIAYVMTDGAALLMAFSRTIPALRSAGLLDTTITAGQATGGELEAVSLYGALAAAKAVARADIAIVAMGPGNLGSGSRWGFASIEVAAVVNAAGAMGGRPIVVPRISFADARERHRGLSHHTATALSVALARAEVTLPPLEPARTGAVRERIDEAGLAERHDFIEIDLGPAERALADSRVPLRSMGRAYEDDPDFFRAAAAAGVRAAELASKR